MLHVKLSGATVNIKVVLVWHSVYRPLLNLPYSMTSNYFSELGHFTHTSEDDLVCKCTNEKIPHFNAPVYLQNKEQIGKVDEIFGPIRDFVSFSTPESWRFSFERLHGKRAIMAWFIPL